ncbi:MAG TPA: hypothetical protein DDW93_11045, partial [Firmicutes bacterium]|nr:hypothetical protein [Bacillota bacterium]
KTRDIPGFVLIYLSYTYLLIANIRFIDLVETGNGNFAAGKFDFMSNIDNYKARGSSCERS